MKGFALSENRAPHDRSTEAHLWVLTPLLFIVAFRPRPNATLLSRPGIPRRNRRCRENCINTSHFGIPFELRPRRCAFMAGSMSMDPLAQINPGQFLMRPGLWVGLAVAAVLITAAVQLHRYRAPI